MTDSEIDLNGVTQVTKSTIINHPAYAEPVLMVLHGWQQNGAIVWDAQPKIVEIKKVQNES
jgi:hypothetical protein